MSNYKTLMCLCLAALTFSAKAQTNGSNSPYSRFGVGALKDGVQGFNSGMSGVAMGFRAGNRVNVQNPASYSSIDSLSFIFDVGMNLQNTNLKQGGTSVNAHNASLEYFNAAFRLNPGLGFAFGFKPFSTIGYNYSNTHFITNDINSGSPITQTATYSGDGGLQEVFMGIGWNPFAQLSIGVNMGYMWGTYEQKITTTSYNDGTSTSNIGGLNRQITADFSTYKLEVGAQYPIRLTKKDVLTVGATYGLGHKLNNRAHCHQYLTNGDTTTVSLDDAFELPHIITAGVAWTRNAQWKAGLDVSYHTWGDCEMPQVQQVGGTSSFLSSSNGYMNRTKVALGGEYTPNAMSNKYLQRVQYRLGMSFATPYFKVDNLDGPREFGVSAGLGLPVSKNPSSKSMVNIAFQWIKAAPQNSSLISENYLQLKVGLTFNERWFMKWKIQ